MAIVWPPGLPQFPLRDGDGGEATVLDLAPTRLIACPAPALPPTIDLMVPAGATIIEMLRVAGADAALLRHGRILLVNPAEVSTAMVVPRERWAMVRPKPGMVIVATAMPANGGGGGGGGKNPMRTVLTIGIMVAAAVATYGMASFLGAGVVGASGAASTWAATSAGLTIPGALTAGAIGGAVTMLGSLAMNAIVPPPRPAISEYGNLGSGSGAGTGSPPRYTLTGARNQARPWETVRKVMGRRRVTPDLFGEIWREVVGDKTYLRIPLMVCEGPAKMSDWRVGETPLSAIKGLELEVREGWDDDDDITLYTTDRHLDPLSVSLTQAGGWFVRRTGPDADEIIVEDVFPRGLSKMTGETTREPLTVEVEIEYSPAGANVWTPLPLVDGSTTITDNVLGTSVLRAMRAKVDRGQYDVQQRRVTADASSNNVVDNCQWVGLTTITYRDPLALKNVARAVVRIEAGQETQGVLDQISCLVEAYAKVQDQESGTWSWQLSRNPADWFIDTLTRWSAEASEYDELHLASLTAWHTDCTTLAADGTPKWCFDAVYEQDVTIRQALLDICGAGRARLSAPEGKLGVIRDIAQAAATQALGPAVSWGFREKELYADLPHAVRVRFEDETQDYRVDEVIYYAPGYSRETATRYEVLETVGVTRHRQAYQEGRYHYAVAIHRPVTYETHINIQALDFEEGDLVTVQHPVILAGLGDAFILEVVRNDDQDVVGVVLDDQVIMESGKRYGVRIRRRTGATRVTDTFEVVVEPGETDTLTFTQPLPVAAEPFPDDYLQFGLLGLVGLPVVVSKIGLEADFGAQITMVDEARAVFADDDGPIPAREVIMTPRPAAIRTGPAAVPMAAIVSDETALDISASGVPIPRILLSLALPNGGGLPPAWLEMEVRRSGATTWTSRPAQRYGASLVIGDVVEDQIYDIRWRPVTETGLAGDWTIVTGHRVVGRTTRPPSPTDLYVEHLPGGTLRYRPVGTIARDHDGWLYRWNPGVNTQWEGAVSAYPGVETSGRLESAAVIARTFTMLVKAVDTIGLESEQAAFAVVQLGDLVTDRLVDQHDLDVLGWPGTITGGAVSDGEVVAEPAEAMFTDPALPMFVDPSTPMVSSFSALDYRASFQVGRRGYLSLDWDISGSGYAIEVRRPGTAPMFTDPLAPMFADPSAPMTPDPAWMAYLGAFGVVAGDPVEIRVTVAGGAAAGRIAALVASVDVPVESETIDDLVVPAEGIRLPITRAYEEVVRVGLTVQGGQGYSAIRAEPLDKSTAGPLVRCYDASGAGVAGENWGGEFRINAAGLSVYHPVASEMNGYDNNSGGLWVSHRMLGHARDSTAITGLQFYPSSGTFSGGTLVLLKRKRSA